MVDQLIKYIYNIFICKWDTNKLISLTFVKKKRIFLFSKIIPIIIIITIIFFVFCI